MSSLFVNCYAVSSDLTQGFQLPFQVLRPDLLLVAQGLCNSKPVDVSPGEYFVRARFPAGQEMVSRVQIFEDRAAAVDLRPYAADESPHESEEVQRYLRGAGTPFAPRSFPSVLEEERDDEVVARRLTAGEILATHVTAVVPRRYSERGAVTLKVLEGTRPEGYREYLLPDPGSLVFITADAQQVVVRIPVDQAPGMKGRLQPARLVLERVTDELYSVSVHPANIMADALLGYTQRTQPTSLGTIWNGIFDDVYGAGELLQFKRWSPVAAAIGAYSILRFGKLEQLRDWTFNLHKWFPWLPDGAAIVAEHLARLGRHDEAFRMLLTLPSYEEFPIFSQGVNIAVDRLRTYLHDPTDAMLVDGGRFRAQWILGELARVAARANFAAPLLTFRLGEPHPFLKLSPLSEVFSAGRMSRT